MSKELLRKYYELGAAYSFLHRLYSNIRHDLSDRIREQHAVCLPYIQALQINTFPDVNKLLNGEESVTVFERSMRLKPADCSACFFLGYSLEDLSYITSLLQFQENVYLKEPTKKRMLDHLVSVKKNIAEMQKKPSWDAENDFKKFEKNFQNDQESSKLYAQLNNIKEKIEISLLREGNEASPSLYIVPIDATQENAERSWSSSAYLFAAGVTVGAVGAAAVVSNPGQCVLQ